MKIGNDIIEIARIKKTFNDIKKQSRVFTQREIEYANKKQNSMESFAGFFAVKESVVKALEGGLITEVEVLHKENGAPYVVLSGKCKELFEKNFKEIEVSISHSNEYASAVVIIG